jgi:hypothetical protein
MAHLRRNEVAKAVAAVQTLEKKRRTIRSPST